MSPSRQPPTVWGLNLVDIHDNTASARDSTSVLLESLKANAQQSFEGYKATTASLTDGVAALYDDFIGKLETSVSRIDEIQESLRADSQVSLDGYAASQAALTFGVAGLYETFAGRRAASVSRINSLVITGP